jgi:hypothetical protein
MAEKCGVPSIPSSAITSESAYCNRRQLMIGGGIMAFTCRSFFRIKSIVRIHLVEDRPETSLHEIACRDYVSEDQVGRFDLMPDLPFCILDCLPYC